MHYPPLWKNSFLLLLLLLNACYYSPWQNPAQSPQSQAPFELLKGETRLCEEIARMTEPKGILSLADCLLPAGITTYSNLSSNEYFVFDAYSALLVLSDIKAGQELYFLKINSGCFYDHFEQEYAQLKTGISAAEKRVNTVFFQKQVQDYRISLFFSPQEIYYAKSGINKNKLILSGDSNITKEQDPWKIFETKSTVLLYTVDFEEQKLFETFQEHTQKNLKRHVIYQKNTVFLAPFIEKKPETSLNFSFILGKTFLMLFSLPFGNSYSSTIDYLRKQNGSVILIQGNMAKIADFFKQEKLNLNLVLE